MFYAGSTKEKLQKEATIERIVNDYKVLSAIKD